jgi:hypothetical protein
MWSHFGVILGSIVWLPNRPQDAVKMGHIDQRLHQDASKKVAKCIKTSQKRFNIAMRLPNMDLINSRHFHGGLGLFRTAEKIIVPL